MPADVLVDAICPSNWPDTALHQVVRPIGLLALHGLACEDEIVV
jgi:hypothetical protein